MIKTSSNIDPFKKKIIESIEVLGGKNFIKQCAKDFNVDKNIVVIFSEDDYVEFHTKAMFIPKFGFIWGSTESLVNIYCGMYSVMKNKKIDLSPTPENIKTTTKIIVAHEIGHILDKGIAQNVINSMYSIIDIADYIEASGRNIDLFINRKVIVKDEDLNSQILNLKKILIEREAIAWNYAKELVDFKNPHEKKMFTMLREYCLATYNSKSLGSILAEYSTLKPFRNLINYTR